MSNHIECIIADALTYEGDYFPQADSSEQMLSAEWSQCESRTQDAPKY